MEILPFHLGTNRIVMATVIKSKHAIVSKAPYMLYMAFVDMRNFVQLLPEDKKKDISADFKDDGAPFSFTISMHFDAAGGDPDKTDFHIELSAELNMVMKMMLGSKLQDALDKIADSLAAVSEGRIPDGVDPDILRKAAETGQFN